MMEMDMRHYDPAIARWVVQDPVIHHSLSPYNAFDNNPIYWADPSGADATSLINDVWNASGSGETKWTNNNDGTFSSDGGQTVDCKECKTEYQWDNFDYEENYDKIRSGMFSDGGHWIGSGSSPRLLQRVLTARIGSSVEYLFTTPGSIEKWNEIQADSRGDLNNAISVFFGWVLSRMGVPPEASAVIAFLQNKYASIEPLDVDLNPGDRLVFGTTANVIRSYNEGEGRNGVEFITTMSVIRENGKQQLLSTSSSFMNLNPLTNKKHSALMRSYELKSGSSVTTLIQDPGTNSSAANINVNFKRTN